MKRHHLTCALACLLAGAATHAAAQTASAGVADPQAPTPASRALPADGGCGCCDHKEGM